MLNNSFLMFITLGQKFIAKKTTLDHESNNKQQEKTTTLNQFDANLTKGFFLFFFM